jgi:hypothetical protein
MSPARKINQANIKISTGRGGRPPPKQKHFGNSPAVTPTSDRPFALADRERDSSDHQHSSRIPPVHQFADASLSGGASMEITNFGPAPVPSAPMRNDPRLKQFITTKKYWPYKENNKDPALVRIVSIVVCRACGNERERARPKSHLPF